VSTPAPSRTPLPGPITDTPTFTPTYTNTPVTPGVPEDYSPVGGSDQSGPGIVVGAGGGACATVPAGTFGAIYQSDPNIPAAMGCPLAANASPMIAAYQRFENGEMIWIQSPTMIYVLYNNGSYQDFSDTFRDGVDPESSGRTDVPSGRLEPIRGFGKVWRTNPAVQQTLGWALAPEAGNEGAQVLLFERGTMIFLPQTNQTYILIASSGTWRAS
jgi:hypothetical protein